MPLSNQKKKKEIIFNWKVHVCLKRLYCNIWRQFIFTINYILHKNIRQTFFVCVYYYERCENIHNIVLMKRGTFKLFFLVFILTFFDEVLLLFLYKKKPFFFLLIINLWVVMQRETTATASLICWKNKERNCAQLFL